MRVFLFTAILLFTFHLSARADVVNLANGDRFFGSIEVVNKSEVHLKSETLGLVKLPRAKVASIYFGTNQPPARVTGLLKDSSQIGFDAAAVDKVQEDFLATAGPEANAMFKQLVQGLASGNLNVEDIRDQARQSLAELKELQGEGGDDVDNAMIAGYVGILERFVNQATNRPKAAAPKAAAPAVRPADKD